MSSSQSKAWVDANVKVFMGSHYCPYKPPHGWGIAVGETFVILSKKEPLVTTVEGVVEHLGECGFDLDFDREALVLSPNHALMDSACVQWMLDRAEPLLRDTPLQHRVHIRSFLMAQLDTDSAMTLSHAWDHMRYTALFSNLKPMWLEKFGVSLREVPYAPGQDIMGR
jgi:hypothetical protein